MPHLSHCRICSPATVSWSAGKCADDGKSLLAASLIANEKDGHLRKKQAHEREEWPKTWSGWTGDARRSPPMAPSQITTTALGTSTKTSPSIFPKIRSCALTLPIPSNSMTQSPRRSAKSKRATNSAPGAAAAADWQRNSRRRSRVWLLPQHRRHDCLHRFRGWNDYGDGLGHQEKPVVVKVTGESQLRKLPPPMAQRIAARLKGTSGDTPPAAAGQPAGGIIRNERHCRNALDTADLIPRKGRRTFSRLSAACRPRA